MELNHHIIEGLTLFGDGVCVPDQAFQTLHNSIQESMLDTNTNDMSHLGKYLIINVNFINKANLIYEFDFMHQLAGLTEISI